MGPPTNIEGAVEMRRWRRRAALSRTRAAAELGISERMLAYYETGEHPTPRSVRLATRALAAGLGFDKPLTRDRWVTLVQNLLAYGQGEPVVGRMLRAGDRDHLVDFLGFVRRGPDADSGADRSQPVSIARCRRDQGASRGPGTFQRGGVTELKRLAATACPETPETIYETLPRCP